MRRRGRRKSGRRSFTCPHCGAEVDARAAACPECGSDNKTGWAEDAHKWAAGIPSGYSRDDEFDYEEFVRREFGPQGGRFLGIPRGRLVLVVFIVVCVVLMGLVLLAR